MFFPRFSKHSISAFALTEPSVGSDPSKMTTTATLTPDGPTHLSGDISLIGPDGAVASVESRMALCRCGASQNKPYCDNSHRKIGFRHEATLPGGKAAAPATKGGRLSVRARVDGPLMCTGPLAVIGADGRSAYAESTFLCRCGGSANKPYCDGSHSRIGFKG